MTRRRLVGARLAALGIIVMGGALLGARRDLEKNLPQAPEPSREILPEYDAEDETTRNRLSQWRQAPWRMPVITDRARLSGRYGVRMHPIRGGLRQHDGIDLAAPTGTAVLAAADGIVIAATTSPSYGRVIDVDHGQGWISRYAHLSRLRAREGEQVRGGQTIGAVGSTGASTGPHLHFEVYFNGQAVDPWDLWEMAAKLKHQLSGARSDSAQSSASLSWSR